MDANPPAVSRPRDFLRERAPRALALASRRARVRRAGLGARARVARAPISPGPSKGARTPADPVAAEPPPPPRWGTGPLSPARLGAPPGRPLGAP